MQHAAVLLIELPWCIVALTAGTVFLGQLLQLQRNA
jgi:hypothetical protein